MNTRFLLVLSLLVVAALAGFGLWLASALPEGAQLPIHFNGAGEPDRFTDALPALMVAPGVLFLVSLLLAVIPSLEPLQDRLEGSAPLMRVVWLGMIAIMIFVQTSIAAPAMEWDLPKRLFYLPLGLLLIAMGNMLPKSRPGFFVGIRTPWTISDTDNWIATHRLGGKLMMLAGFVVAANTFLPTGPGLATGLVLGPILIAAIIPLIYSWWFWRQKQRAA